MATERTSLSRFLLPLMAGIAAGLALGRRRLWPKPPPGGWPWLKALNELVELVRKQTGQIPDAAAKVLEQAGCGWPHCE